MKKISIVILIALNLNTFSQQKIADSTKVNGWQKSGKTSGKIAIESKIPIKGRNQIRLSSAPLSPPLPAANRLLRSKIKSINLLSIYQYIINELYLKL